MLTQYQFDQTLAMDLATKAAFVVGILVVTWVLAKAAKWAFAKIVDKVSLLQRGTSSGASIGESMGKIVSLLIWLFGLMAVLNVLELEAVAGPINSLLENIVDFVPNLIGAGLILFIGLMIAGIVRDIATTAMQTVDLDKWANKGGVDNVTGNTAISKTIGLIIYVLIAIPVGILALDALDLTAISEPASAMLGMILTSIPKIIVAAILLGIGYFISKFVVGVLQELLSGLGVDRSLEATGLLPDGTTASSIIARIVQVAIILFFAIAATNQLGFAQLTDILNEILTQGGSVVFGAVIIGVGFLIANLLAKLVGGASEGSSAATIVRWITIILFTVMGLQKTDIGGMLPGNALLVMIVGASVAAALAFGLGGREWAARKLDEWDKK
ncbi:mechanosensitive ion channel [Qipengyuania sp. DGS5-3]|uniref:mechanosensitive ion channel n=1 Tax=Qipengyuania sp. DGS5-3 TaxID=3349632 RepID=UPI0036D2D6EF